MSITDVINMRAITKLLSGNTPQKTSIRARNSLFTRPKKQFSSLMDRPWIRLDQAGMNLRLKIYRY